MSSSILHRAYTIFPSLPAPSEAHTLNGQLISLRNGDALIDFYIDDVLGLCAGWTPQQVNNLYRHCVCLFEEYGLPRHPKKSLPLQETEVRQVSFTGWILDLKRQVVFPNTNKVLQLQRTIRSIDRESITVRELMTLTGKVIWYSLSQRPLLSCLDSIFRHHQSKHLDLPAHPSREEILELRRLSMLLPLAHINLRLPWSRLIISTDASGRAGAVVYASVQPHEARALYAAFLKAVPKGNRPPDPDSQAGKAYILQLQRLVEQARWTTAYAHKWRRQEHIGCLEASIPASSLHWAASKGLQDHNFIFLTDSSSTLGAFSKGRSSIGNLLARCREVAAITLAHNLSPRFCFIPTKINPADAPSRAA